MGDQQAMLEEGVDVAAKPTTETCGYGLFSDKFSYVATFFVVLNREVTKVRTLLCSKTQMDEVKRNKK